MSFMTTTYSKHVPIGTAAPKFSIASGKRKITLDSFQDRVGFVLVFANNHCSEVELVWPLLLKLWSQHGQEVGMLAVNPDDEDRFPTETRQETELVAQELSLPFPYLKDAKAKVAKLFQAQTMPEGFVYKQHRPAEFRLFYHGHVGPELVRSVERLVTNQPPLAIQALATGCAIPEIVFSQSAKPKARSKSK